MQEKEIIKTIGEIEIEKDNFYFLCYIVEIINKKLRNYKNLEYQLREIRKKN